MQEKRSRKLGVRSDSGQGLSWSMAHAVRETGDGYKVIIQTSHSCGGRRVELRVEVDRSGETRVSETAVLNPGSDGPDCA